LSDLWKKNHFIISNQNKMSYYNKPCRLLCLHIAQYSDCTTAAWRSVDCRESYRFGRALPSHSRTRRNATHWVDSSDNWLIWARSAQADRPTARARWDWLEREAWRERCRWRACYRQIVRAFIWKDKSLKLYDTGWIFNISIF
jgi:hypothetical protein